MSRIQVTHGTASVELTAAMDELHLSGPVRPARAHPARGMPVHPLRVRAPPTEGLGMTADRTQHVLDAL